MKVMVVVWVGGGGLKLFQIHIPKKANIFSVKTQPEKSELPEFSLRRFFLLL